MKKTTVEVLRNTQGETTTVEGYEIEPGWVVHRSVEAPESWAVTHAETGRFLLRHSPTRAHAVRMFEVNKADGTIARALKRLKEDE